MTPEPEHFSTQEFCKLTGLTPRQAQYRDEHSLVPATHVGHIRKWSFEDALLARIYKRISSVYGHAIFRDAQLRIESLKTRYLVAGMDHKRLLAISCQSDAGVITAFRHIPRGAILIDIQEMREELEKRLTQVKRNGQRKPAPAAS
jgi:DNA-binding transcriptional MerR regulator